MLTVLLITNPFHFDLDGGEVARYQVPNGASINSVLQGIFPGFVEFEFPTICLVNSEPIMRKKWDDRLPDDATVSFVRLAGGWVAIIIAVVVVIAAIIAVAVIQRQNPAAIGASSTVAGEQKNGGDTVYSLSGERNQNKLNNSIEAAYGRNRHYPAYAARPYNVYAGNQQFQFSLFCLGHGQFDIEKMLFEDTPLQNFDDVEFEIVNPGETFDLFHDDVITSTEVQGIELFGPNEAEFTGVTPGFVTNPPQSKASLLEMDVSFPSGLYKIDELGKQKSEQITIQFYYASVDDAGAMVGAWKILPLSTRKILFTLPTSANKKTQYVESTSATFSREMSTLTPQRFTVQARVPAGRYMVRAQRINKRKKSAQAANQVVWESLRAFLPPVKTYGDVTLVAVKARASNNLNNNAAAKFNVIASRKVPTWSSAGWSAPIVTRNPVWAFCDVFRSVYGGRLPDKFLDLEGLKELADEYSSSGVTFDYIFDQKTTVWEAARAICLVGRGVPMLNGSRITIIRDRLRSAASAVFNQYNIVADSLTWSATLRKVEDFDGIEVEYLDPDTWKPETVLCLIAEDDNGDHPESLKMPGCQDRSRAFHEGLYRRAAQLFQREVLEFKTGLEGHLPRYGDLILISHDVPRWGTGGLVTSIHEGLVTLSESVTFLPDVVHKLVLRKRDGSAFGPVVALPGSNDHEVSIRLSAEGSLRQFDYAVIRYLWTEEDGTDLDTRTAIIDLDPSVNGRDVGWGASRSYTVGGESGQYLTWNGDNTGTGTEAVLLDCARLAVDFPDKTSCRFRLRANWYAARGTGNMQVSFTTYKGGTMSQDGFNFINTGGTVVDEITMPFNVASNSATDADGDQLAILLYDFRTGIGSIGENPVIDDQGLNLADFIFDTNHELPFFLFGQESIEIKRCVVVGITPEAEDILSIRCVNYDERVFSYGAVPTPAKYAPPSRVVDPDRPVVERVDVLPIPGVEDRLIVSWPPALGAKSYVVEQSPDGIDWTRSFAQSTTSTEIRVTSEVLYLRVAGVNVDIGPYAYWNGRAGNVLDIPDLVTGIHLVASGPGFATIGWNSLDNVDGYFVNTYEATSGRLLRRSSVFAIAYTYTLDFGDSDGLIGREVKFLIHGHNIKGTSDGADYFQTIIPERIIPSETADKTFTTTDKTEVQTDTY